MDAFFHAIAIKRYINQLLILSRLRNSEHVTEELINDMPIFYDVEKDSLYQKGMKKGIEKGIALGEEKGIALGEEKVIEKSVILLHKAGYSATEISEAYDYNLEKVIHIIDFYKLKNEI